MVYQENFYTFQNIRKNSQELRVEIEGLIEIQDFDQALLREIELHLTLGHEHFHAKRYQLALKEYLLAQGLIYKLLEPEAPVYPGIKTETFVKVDHFESLIFEIIERLKRYKEFTHYPFPPIIDPIDPIDPSPEVILTHLHGLGISAPEPTPNDPMRQINIAVELAKAGQFERSVTILTEVLVQIGEEQTYAHALAEENLGIIFSQTGKMGEAQKSFQTAISIYTTLNMSKELGGALENQAAMWSLSGNVAEAIGSLNGARQTYEAAAAQAQGENKLFSSDGFVRIATEGHAENPNVSDSVQRQADTSEYLNASIRIQSQINDLKHVQSRGFFLGRLWQKLQRSIEAPASANFQMQYRQEQNFSFKKEDMKNYSFPKGSATNQRILKIFAAEKASATASAQPKILQYNLNESDLPSRLVKDYYESRVGALDLDSLGINAFPSNSPLRFEVDLPHHYFFTIHLCLGKVYTALGRFEDALQSLHVARDYPYLNRNIEAPLLWMQIAEVYIAWGNYFYRRDDRLTAREKYLKVIFVELEDVHLPNSELYSPGVFNRVKENVLDLIPVLDGGHLPAINPEIERIVREAYMRLRMIEGGLNWFGVPASPVTIFRFKYLQSVARYFAEQAINAEREYINFWTNAERETQTMMQLEQAVEVAEDSVELENRRLTEAEAMRDVAEAALEVANIRLDNIEDRKDQYSTLGRDIIALDTATAHASGGFTDTDGGYDVYLNSAGGTVDLGDEDYVIMKNAANRRGNIQYALEMANMDRAIAELTASVASAEAQLQLAEVRVSVAQQGKAIAETRKRHADENLEFAQNKVFTPELWFNLAQALKEISSVYLQRAVEISFLMQDAYNFEFDQTLRIIKSDYTSRNELSGLLAGNFLLTDIDYFIYHRITQVTQKALPTKVNWSLGQSNPFILYEFRQTGKAKFEISVDDLDEMFPGSYLSKLQTVEIIIEGLIGADGIHGIFSNSGISLFRTKDGEKKARIQPRETMLLSSYNLRNDAIVFRPSEEIRGIFEDSGVATSWDLEIPRGTNDLNYNAIRDIRIVFYFESFYNSLLAENVTAALPVNGTWSRSYSVLTEFPDAFFRFQDTGELFFDIRKADFPYNHDNVLATGINIMVLPDSEHGRVATLRLKHPDDPDPVAFTTNNETGVFSSDADNPANPLNSFIGNSPLSDWLLSMDFENNPDFIEDEVPPRVKGIKDIIISLNYNYQRRA